MAIPSAALSSEHGGQQIAAPPPAPPSVPAQVVLHSLPGETPFVAWPVRRLGGREVLDALPLEPAAGQVRSALEDVVQAEGPVHVDRLARLVAAAFDLTRVSPSRMEAILAQLPRQYRRDHTEPFAWPDTIDPATWTGFRRAPESDPRPVDQVGLREIGNAMAALCHVSAGMYREELLRETLSVFGGKRLTPGIQARVDQALADTIQRGVLTADPSGLVSVVAR